MLAKSEILLHAKNLQFFAVAKLKVLQTAKNLVFLMLGISFNLNFNHITMDITRSVKYTLN